MTTKSVQIAVRFEPATLELADEVVRLSAARSLVPPNRTAVLRVAAERGLELMHAELKAAARKK